MKKTTYLLLLVALLLSNLMQAQNCRTSFDYYKRGKDVVFYSTSTLAPSPWQEWNFGDGSGWQYTVEDHVIKSYATPGTYLVCLRDSFCPTNSLYCDSVRISNQIPVVADFTYALDSFGKITLYNEATSSSAIISHYWDLGDGFAFEGESDSLVHQYKKSGTYSVCLYAFDAQKNYNYRCSTIVVDAPEPCYADFTYSIANGEYYFLNQSYFPGDSANWLWNFGDNTTSTERDPKHTYTAEGNYEVSLTLNGPCNSLFKKTIYVPRPGLCNLNVSATTINQNATIRIIDSSATPSLYHIDFGDGESLTTSEFEVEHIYPDTGNYVIVVQSFNPICGEVYGFTYLRVNNAVPICRAGFTAYPGDTSGNKVFVLSNSRISANGNNKSYIKLLWGDGSFEIDSINKMYYEHEYDSAGIYTIKMIVSNQLNCADTAYQSVGVGPVYLVKGRVKQGNKPAIYNIVNAFMFEPQSGTLSFGFATITDDSGYYEMYLRKGYYILQTDFAFDPTTTEFYLPTYYGDKLNWTSSDVLTIVGNRSNLDINQIPFTPINQNNGRISGTAIFGNNVKHNGQTMPEGMPVEKMLIFLLDDAGKPVAFTHSDHSGKFEFANTGSGNFTVWAEMPGKATIPPFVYLSKNNPEATNIKLVIGQSAVTSVNPMPIVAKNTDFEIYPNPSSTFVNIRNIGSSKEIESISFYNLNGQSINLEVYNTNEIWQADVNNLEPGLYFIHIKLVDGSLATRKFIKSN